MVKNKNILLAAILLTALFGTVMFALPSWQLEESSGGQTYKQTVFNQSKVTEVDIQLPEKDLEKILETPLEEEVVEADVVIGGKKVSSVGLRTKGNLTLRSVAQMENSDRYSWKLDFDYYQEGQSLDGLKKLNLNNNYSDASMMREYLSYQLMEEMGVPAPGRSYMYVTINGKEWGLYLGVEAVEETFLQQHFAKGTGDLYKPDGTGSDLKWISNDIKDYTGINLKTNKETSSQSAMISMLDAINNGGDLDQVLDTDEMLRYFAANTALVNLDHYQGSLKHNYYLYEEDGVFSILPWDYNMAFGGFGGMGGGRGEPEDELAETAQDLPPGKDFPGGMGKDMSSGFLEDRTINFSITSPVSGTSMEDRPLLNALLKDDTNRAAFNQYLEEIASGFFSEERMTEMTGEIEKLITPYVEKDPTKFYSTEEFKENATGEESLIEFAKRRSESILDQLSGELVVDAETDSGFGGGQFPEMGAEENFPAGDLPGGPDGSGPPAMNGQDGNEQGRQNGEPAGERGLPPGMDGQGGPFNADKDMKPQEMDRMQGARGPVAAGYSAQTLIVTGVCFVLLAAATLFVFRFKRRRT